MTARQRNASGGRPGRNRARSRNASRQGNEPGRSGGEKERGGPPQDTSSGKSSSNRGRQGRKGRRRPQADKRRAGDETIAFWGDADQLPELRTDVRITDDPAAVPRSLGRPPLPGHEQIAEHYFTAVYDRAVATAGALAAAGGLIDAEALAEEYGD